MKISFLKNKTMEQQKTQVETIIALWKQLEITSVDFNFNCGGDSMNDTDIVINTKNGSITNDVIHDYFDNIVYNKVEFYVNSDGHYQGESGVVEITLEDDDDDDFSYNKSAESEWTENQTEVVDIQLTSEEKEFIQTNIININGDENNVQFVFVADTFLTDEDEVFLEGLEKKIESGIRDYEPNVNEGELQEWYNFNTEENNISITDEGLLEIDVNYSITVYRDSND
jgi:hypothetical protein